MRKRLAHLRIAVAVTGAEAVTIEATTIGATGTGGVAEEEVEVETVVSTLSKVDTSNIEATTIGLEKGVWQKRTWCQVHYT